MPFSPCRFYGSLAHCSRYAGTGILRLRISSIIQHVIRAKYVEHETRRFKSKFAGKIVVLLGCFSGWDDGVGAEEAPEDYHEVNVDKDAVMNTQKLYYILILSLSMLSICCMYCARTL